MSDLLPASRIFSRVSSHSHWSMHAVSRRFNVLRRSHHPSLAISLNVCTFHDWKVPKGPEGSINSLSLCSRSSFFFSHLRSDSIAPSDSPFHCLSFFGKSIFGYRSCILPIFFWRNSSTSSGFIDSRIYVRQRERSALMTVKLGFSVVAPMRVIIHFSTQGRSTSCWDLLHRWISSRKRIVCRHSLKFFCAFPIIFTTSSFFARTAERWKNSASIDFEITLARLVFPHPGGHQRRIDGSRPASINFRIGLPGPIRWDCPTRSSSFSGLRREARGVMSREKRDCMEWFYLFRKEKEIKNRNEALVHFYFLNVSSRKDFIILWVLNNCLLIEFMV